MAAAVQGARSHLRFRVPDGVHASVKDCQDCGAFVGPLRRHQVHLETSTRDDGFVALPRDVYPGSETVLQSAAGFHVCPREGLDSTAVTVEPSRRRSVAISSVQIRRIAGYVFGAFSRRYAWADTGSRSWDTEDDMLRFKNLRTNYEQVAVPEAWRNPSRAWQKLSDGNPWPEIASINIKDIERSGSNGAK
jgi:hypothetical protein